MFREFFRFEVSYWLRGWMVYIFLAVIALLFGVAAGSDAISIAGVAQFAVFGSHVVCRSESDHGVYGRCDL